MRSICLSIMAAALLPGGCSLDRVTHDAPCTVREPARQDARAGMRWVIDSPQDATTVRVRYHRLAREFGCLVVEGRLADSGLYPVVLDTGAAGEVFVNDIHVRENDLPVIQTPAGDDRVILCRLERVRIGAMELQQPTCWYIQPAVGGTRSQRTLSAPAQSLAEGTDGNHASNAGDRSLIIGLPALRELSYLLVDDVRQEAEFSLRQSFEPARPERWSRYPLMIQEDGYGYPSLLVKVPVAGQCLWLQLDTGSAGGLATPERLWSQFPRRFRQVHLTQGSAVYPYIGRLPCQYASLSDLQVGDRTLERCRVQVLPDDSVLLANGRGLLGMACFKDTTVVLDFRKRILWVANSATQ